MKNQLLLLALMLSVTTSVFAERVEIDDLWYELDLETKEAKISGHNGTISGNIMIPETVKYENNTYRVTGIGSSAFDNCYALTTVTIPNSVTTIEDYAFNNTELKTFVVGSGVLSIGANVFSTCPVKTIWLTNTPPQNYKNAQGTINYVSNNQYSELNYQKEYKFLSSMFDIDGIKYVPVSPSDRTCDAIDCIYDKSINEININAYVSYKGLDMNVINVMPYSFCGNNYLQKVSYNITGSINKSIFKGCQKLQNVILGDNVTGIGDYAFYGCSILEDIILPASVKRIGQYAFSNCTSLSKVSIGDGMTSIGQYAFQNCSSLPCVVIPQSVESIKDYAFSGCSSLTEILFSDDEANALLVVDSNGKKTTSIGQYAFQNCSSLTRIVIPEIVESIKDYAFSGCSNLTEVILSDGDANALLSLGSNGNDPLFADCPLNYVYVGRNIVYNTNSSYGYSPFYCNRTLRTVVITDKENEISSYEFYGCTNLKDVTIGNGVRTIGDWAFSRCGSLDSFEFGKRVISIGKEAFSDCTAITMLSSHTTLAPACETQALDDINKWNCTLSVPKGCTTVYQNADQWKDFFFINEMNPGDVNADNAVDVADVVAVVNYILNQPDENFNEKAADINGDKIIDIVDVVKVVNIILTSDSSQDSIDLVEYINQDVSFVISEGIITATSNNEACLTAMNFTDYGKAIIEVTENGKKKFVIFNVKAEDSKYSITDDTGQILGTVTGYVRPGTTKAIINVSITISINGITYVFSKNSAEADMQYATMTGGNNLVNIARTWRIRNMKLTLESDDPSFMSLAMTESSGKLSAFVAEVKKRDTGFSNTDIDKLNKEIKSVTLDMTGLFVIEYTDGGIDAATWRWNNSSFSNIAIKWKNSECGNKFIQDNTRIAVDFNNNLCRLTCSTTINRENKRAFVVTLNIVMEPK